MSAFFTRRHASDAAYTCIVFSANIIPVCRYAVSLTLGGCMFSSLLLFYFALRQCVAHVLVRHEVTNPLTPQQPGVVPMPTRQPLPRSCALLH